MSADSTFPALNPGIGRSRLLSALAALAVGLGLSAPVPADWLTSGDLRTGYTASWRDARDGTDSSSDQLRARLRLRLGRDLGGNWRGVGRLAGTFSSDEARVSFDLSQSRPTRTGLEDGDVTLDELYLGYAGPAGGLEFRFGRFQTGFTLPTVPAKSLDRNDSSNFGIGWTDGAHLILPVTGAWRAHLIGQVHSRDGTGNTLRPPLDFRETESRASLFAGLEATEHPGPLVLRMIGLTWLPETLATDGIDSQSRQDYLALTAKLGAAWPLSESGLRLVVSGEAGHAFDRPRRATVGLDGPAEVSGNAFQLTASLYDIRPGHHLGVVYARAQAGWLISTDFRPNDELAEARYQWRISRALSMETRFRWRRELELPEAAERPRRDRDVYARLTWRF